MSHGITEGQRTTMLTTLKESGQFWHGKFYPVGKTDWVKLGKTFQRFYPPTLTWSVLNHWLKTIRYDAKDLTCAWKLTENWQFNQRNERIKSDNYEAFGVGRSSTSGCTLSVTAVVRIRTHAAAVTLWTTGLPCVWRVTQQITHQLKYRSFWKWELYLKVSGNFGYRCSVHNSCILVADQCCVSSNDIVQWF